GGRAEVSPCEIRRRSEVAARPLCDEIAASGDVMVSIEAQRARLEAWLERTIAGTSEVRLSSLRLPKGTGQSAETIFADVEYRIGQKREKRKLVVRQQAEEEGLFFRTSLMTQYRMMSCL